MLIESESVQFKWLSESGKWFGSFQKDQEGPGSSETCGWKCSHWPPKGLDKFLLVRQLSGWDVVGRRLNMARTVRNQNHVHSILV